jgi:tetratricopeptide (TPR) repeat protein
MNLRMQTRRFKQSSNTVVALFVLVVDCVSCRERPTVQTYQSQNALSVYVRVKKQEADAYADSCTITIPSPVTQFFTSAISSPRTAMSGFSNALWSIQQTGDVSIEAFKYPMLDIAIASSVTMMWDYDLANDFNQMILSGIPDGSLLILGDDAVPFALRKGVVGAKRPAIVSQGRLAEYAYIQYLNSVHKQLIWLPTTNTLNRAFDQIVAEVEAGSLPKTCIDIRDGRIVPSEPFGRLVMGERVAVATLLGNAPHRNCFVLEGSIPLQSACRHLVPAGLLLRFVVSPQEKIGRREVDADNEFWRRTLRCLRKSTRFRDCYVAQRQYAGLRAAIAGTYECRGQWTEAERAYMQALELCPKSSENYIRLAQLYLRGGRVSDAHDLLKKFLSQHPTDNAVATLAGVVEKVLKYSRRILELESRIASGVIDVTSVLELLDDYRMVGRMGDFDRIARALIAKHDLPPSAFHVLVRICQAAERVDMLIKECKAVAGREPQDKRALLNLAAAYVAAGNRDESIATLKRVAGMTDVDIAELLGDDRRFDVLRCDGEFKQIIGAP